MKHSTTLKNLKRLNKALMLTAPMQGQIQKLTDAFIVDSDAALELACERQYTHLFIDEAYLHKHVLTALACITELQTANKQLQVELDKALQPKTNWLQKLWSNIQRLYYDRRRICRTFSKSKANNS